MMETTEQDLAVEVAELRVQVSRLRSDLVAIEANTGRIARASIVRSSPFCSIFLAIVVAWVVIEFVSGVLGSIGSVPSFHITP